MVEPERDTPGTIAAACARPMQHRVAQRQVADASPLRGESIDHVQEDAHEQHRGGDQPRIAKGVLGLLLEQEPDQRARHRAYHHVPGQPAFRVVAHAPLDHAGEQRARRGATGRGGNRRSSATSVPTCRATSKARPGSSQPAPREHGQVRRAADGQELAQALDQAEDDRLEERHGMRRRGGTRRPLQGSSRAASRRHRRRFIGLDPPASAARRGNSDVALFSVR